MKQKILYIITLSLLSIAFAACSDNDESFDNNIYIDSSVKTKNIFLKGNETEQASFQVSMPKKESKDVVFTISPDASLVPTYNEAYYDNAIMLPEGYYTISDSAITINAGSVLSTEITVTFNKLTKLDRQQKYVLPVSISSADVGVLQSARTMYYVLKGAALINVVADLEKNNLFVDWEKPDDFNAMRQFTAEVLIRARNFDRTLSTIMGIEGKFLIRIGDSGIPSNQLQVATSGGNFTSSDLSIPTNEWTHIAVTYDADAGKINIFINGKNLYSASASVGAVNWGVPYVPIARETNSNRCFRIGYAYESSRYLAGEMSECRIWNKVLTSADINELNHFYSVDPASEGLIAYWKFDDGNGMTVKDHSVNGNNATASEPLSWNSVELPAE